MKILAVNPHTFEELEAKLRQVKMLKNDVRPYEAAHINLSSHPVTRLMPAQRYVLRSELQKVRALRWALREHGHDPLRLDGLAAYLTLRIEGIEEPIDLLPPIVEMQTEASGETHDLINDGMHRCFLAWMEYVNPVVVEIGGVRTDCPYYAYPVRGGFESVQIVDAIPEGFIKKWHRIRDYKTLYRDFNSAFQNVGGPRGRTV